MTQRFPFLVLLVAALLFVAGYLLAAAPNWGFPLDDAWIHQTYARNLAQTGRWEYLPGIASAGSTAPLWTVWLTVGYLLAIPYRIWAYLTGTICLLGLASAGISLAQSLWHTPNQPSWLAGWLLISSWSLVWAAASGMETLFFAALGLTLCALFARSPTPSPSQTILWGFLSGLLILIRPDGLILTILLAIALLFSPLPILQRFSRVTFYLFATLLPLLPYFAFHLSLSDTIFPNTLYAKQAEYHFLLTEPLGLRLLRLFYFSWGGAASGWQGISAAHLLLLPGGVAAAWIAIRQGKIVALLPLLWAGGHLFLYAWRLPVTYQHGRYLMPALPVWLLFGWYGWVWLFQQLRLADRWQRLLRRTFALTFATLTFFFLLLGAGQYAQDVAFIENEMVAAAHWLEQNTPTNALVAAHDIGAIGYFAQRPLLDLAGLITPEIIPFLADESELATYIWQNGADYLVTAPGWEYWNVLNAGTTSRLYQTNFQWTRDQGFNNSAIYQLHSP